MQFFVGQSSLCLLEVRLVHLSSHLLAAASLVLLKFQNRIPKLGHKLYFFPPPTAMLLFYGMEEKDPFLQLPRAVTATFVPYLDISSLTFPLW